MRLMLAVNRDIMIRSIILQLCFTAFVFLGARFGDVTLAANQVLMQFLSITAFALDGIAFAAEALIGQAIGSRQPSEARRAARLAMQWGFGGAVLMAVAIALSGPALIALMTTAPDVRAEALRFLPWLVASPLIGIAAWIFDGIFIGATLTRAMVRASILSATAYVAALFLLVPGFGNHGLWAALMVLNIARGVTLLIAYPAVARKAAA